MIVGDVLVNFRSALRALVPCAVRAGIGWRREDAYDEWDDMVTSVFKGLVHEPLRWALPESERERFELPPYDLLLERYTTPTVVEVMLEGSEGMRIFHALGTRGEPFDVCECRALDENGVPTSSELESHPLQSDRFRLRHRTEDDRIILLDKTRVRVTAPVR